MSVAAAAAVSHETAERLRALAAAVTRWNPAVNLIARSTVPRIWERHVIDSLQLLDLAPPNPGRWVDLGSGGGFPGLVVAVVLAERAPAARVILVEADRRKAAFLMTTAQSLGVSVEVRAARIESLAPLAGDLVSARALAPLAVLLPWVLRHLAPGGTALMPKGAGLRAELEGVAIPGAFDVDLVPSKTDPDGTILRLRSTRHA